MARVAGAAAVAAGLIFGALWLQAQERYGRDHAFAAAAGAAFGAILQRSRLCFAAAFREAVGQRDRRAALGVLAALAVGSAGYAVVFGAHLEDPGSPHVTPPYHWTAHITPAGWHLLLGGASFGLGMVLAGGCIGTNLYRLGEGSLAAPAVLAGVIVGYWLGFAAWNRLWIDAVSEGTIVWLPRSLGYTGALAVQMAALAGLAALLMKLPGPPSGPCRLFVDRWPATTGGAAVGVLAVFAFFRGAPLGVTAEIGRLSRLAGDALGILPERLEGLDRLRGCQGILSDGLTPNGAFVLALVGGALAAALAAGEFRLRVGPPRSHALGLVGGVFLGFGAMISLGCTVGTFLSGIMAFSLSGWIFGVGLAVGALAGDRMMRRLSP